MAEKPTKLDSKDVTQIREETLPSAISESGKEPDVNFFSKVSSWFHNMAKAVANSESWLAKIFKGVTLYGAIVAGTVAGAKVGGAIGSAISGGLLGLPGVIVGGIAGGLMGVAAWAIAGVVMQGEDPITLVRQSVDIATKVGGAGLSLWAASTIANVAGTSIPQLVQGLLNFGDIIYEFNFDIPNSEIWKQINSIIDGLYGQAGQFLGSSFMRFIITGTLAPPKIQIDIRGIALAYCEYAEEKRKQLLDGISNFAWVGLNAAKRIGFLFAFLQGRDAIKLAVQSIPNIKETMPDFYELVHGWGDEENPNTPESEIKDWRISTWVEKKVDSIGDPRIKSFVEGFLDGARDVIEDDIMDYFEFRYA
ncbi:hypothetical protein [Planktothrix sp. FACHB-1365]|uniref:hypothetical protein n=1 Tax=Planktothrix sp. FACHB-1365 TaxID=2692855 RepID=UPI00168484F7|nr:hypothetical protein [Planktothrix sp. FACHB-1365]MBD2481542.1 hypothetical protein [Planktothrix sp. FACHB-1365]